MYQMDSRDALNLLRQAGFSLAEIERLIKLRHLYAHKELEQAPDDQRWLEFVR